MLVRLPSPWAEIKGTRAGDMLVDRAREVR